MSSTTGKFDVEKGRDLAHSRYANPYTNTRNYASLDESGSGPIKSIEGYILIVRNVHEEAQDSDVLDAFADFGEVKNMQLGFNRRNGYCKGYAFVEFSTFEDAKNALNNMNGSSILGQPVSVDWAFSKN